MAARDRAPRSMLALRRRHYFVRRAGGRRPSPLQRAVAELAVLNEIGRVISAQLHLEDVLETLRQQTSRLMDTSNFYIALYNVHEGTISFPVVYEGGQRQYWSPRHWSHGLTERLLESQQPMLVRSMQDFVTKNSVIRRGQPSRSWIGAPIVLGDRSLGAITVHNIEREAAFDARDLEMLVTIACHAAVAIANADTYRHVEQALSSRLAEMEALEAVARDLNATLELPEVMTRLVSRAVEVVGADAGMVALYDAEQEVLRLMAHRGYPDSATLAEGRSWQLSSGIIGRVARTRTADVSEPASEASDYISVRASTVSQLTLPIIRGEELLGVLALESDRQQVFSPERLHFVHQMAEHAALAIQNARTFAEARTRHQLLQTRSSQLAEVLRVSRALSANLQLEDLLPEIVRAVHSSLGFNIAILSLFDPGPPAVMRRQASAGLPADEWERLLNDAVPHDWYLRVMRDELRVSNSYFIPHDHEIYEEIWGDTQDSGGFYRPDLGERHESEWHPDDSLFVPLYEASGQLIGVLSVDDPVDRLIPRGDTIQLLEIFANQAAVAIENARRFGESQRLAHTDALTGLFNHRHFVHALEQEVSQSHRYGMPLALLALDIDYFKSYNDQFGHLEGNTLLRELAAIVQQTVRSADIAARVGGEEFVVILPQAEFMGAITVAERLREVVAAHPFGRRSVTVSIGVAELKPGMTAHDLHAAADAALYAAKGRGRNLVVF